MRRILIALCVLVGVAALAGPARAQNGGQGGEGGDDGAGAGEDGGDVSGGDGSVLVINVSGLIDPVVVDFVERSIDDAERDDAVRLVLQLNSEGTVVDDGSFVELGRAIVDAEVPVDVWVGPSGAQALGGAAELVGIAQVSGMAPGTRLGDIGGQRLPVDEFGPVFGPETDRLLDESVDDEEALELGLVTEFPPIVVETEDGEEVTVPGAPTVGDFIVNLEGVETREIEVGDQVRREPVTTVLFSRLSLLDQLAHTVASPAVAYLLLAIGLGLLVFELYTAGVGIAGVVGAGCVVFAGYGLWVLPTNWWAVVLIGFAFFGFAIDVQTGVPRVWSVIGMLAFVVGSFGLFDGLSLSWITLLAAIGGVLLAFFAGMPAMVRTRFSTPTIGRDWMIGEEGTVVAEVAPEGVVEVRGARWRARTNRATPVAVGEPVRVAGIDRLLLEVEPLEGAARDHRERGR